MTAETLNRAATAWGEGRLYREDLPEVRARLAAFWDGEGLGRPAMLLGAPREAPLEAVPPVEEPKGWVTRYSISDFDYRVYLSRVACVNTIYLGESVPCVAPDLAPNCLALYLGCEGVEMPGTVWCKPYLTEEEPPPQAFPVDEENVYWRFTLDLGREQLRYGAGKWQLQFPDLIEGLDTLEAIRGGERLLMDFYDRPAWVHDCLDTITERYFHYYDRLYEMFKDETGGSIFWMWAPGRMAKLQCDFSAMIGPEMFGEYMVPVLERMTARLDHCMYHWDGPGAVPHHDHLLGLENLDMLQWTPGAGQPPVWDRSWWPMYHKTLDAGKKLLIGADTLDTLEALKKEFGVKLNQCALGMRAESEAHAEEILRVAVAD